MLKALRGFSEKRTMTEQETDEVLAKLSSLFERADNGVKLTGAELMQVLGDLTKEDIEQLLQRIRTSAS
jgi:hypothetical protein